MRSKLQRHVVHEILSIHAQAGLEVVADALFLELQFHFQLELIFRNLFLVLELDLSPP